MIFMPKREDIQKILLIGPGPVVIGQSGEFDYALHQACRILKQEGFKVVLINSDPITLAADITDTVYIQPLTLESLLQVIDLEKPDALLPVFGGQIAVNLAYLLAQSGQLDQYPIKFLGSDGRILEKTEDRLRFRELITEIGLKLPSGAIATGIDDGMAIGQQVGFPAVIRASLALEGVGVMVAYNMEELEEFIEIGLNASPIHQVLIEKSLYGWRELEFEVIRDSYGQCLIVSSVESIDPLGVHIGDSAVTIPAYDLAPLNYVDLTEVCERIIKKLGVVGGMNLQLAMNPVNGEVVIIEVNPRFTKSGALVAKTTGFQIPAVTAKLAVGYDLNEALADSHWKSQPTLDYCTVKLPRFSFEKFPEADQVLGTTMKSVGEVMAFGCDFKEAFQKAIRSMMNNRYGLGADGRDMDESKLSLSQIKEKITNPNAERWFYLRYALKMGMSAQELANLSKLSNWFIKEIQELVALEKELTTYALYNLTPAILLQAKKWGFSDVQLAYLLRTTEDDVRATRLKKEIQSSYVAVEPVGLGIKRSSYLFSTYSPKVTPEIKKNPKVMIIGSGATRIGQGTEYDYCINHAARAVTESDYASMIVNCNPSAVSTDPANSDILYFEPLTKEDIVNVISREEPTAAIIQFSGRAAHTLVNPLQKSGIKILGTPLASYEYSSNWGLLKEMLNKLNLPFPGSGRAVEIKGAMEMAAQIGYPMIVRPSFSMDNTLKIIYDSQDLKEYVEDTKGIAQNNPLLMEKFLDDAIGVVVDCVCDGKELVICGIVEQIEEAGINPSDCACVIPPYSIGEAFIAKIKANTRLLAEELQIKGLLSVQYAIKHDALFLLRVSPQADPLLPFISKATGVDWMAAATRIMLDNSIQEQGLKEVALSHITVKEAVFSFDRFPGIDTLLGPEMRSSGTVMGIDLDFGMAFIKSQLAAGEKIPSGGRVFLSIRDEDRRLFISIVRQLIDLGFTIMAVEETATALNRNNLSCQTVYNVGEGRPNIVDKIKNGEIDWIISITAGRKTKPDEVQVRSTAVQRGIPITTTVSAAQAAVMGLTQYIHNQVGFKSLAEYYQK
jgi:carbamoyl-phosphate synthase large subunit